MFKQRKLRVTVFLFTLVVLLVAMTGTAFAKVNSTSSSLLKFDYVSLGDSLAAGQTPYNVTTGYGYTDIIADKLAGEGVLGSYSKYGISGYKTSDVLNQLQDTQVINSIYNAEIVTIDIGANDFLKGETLQYLIDNPDQAPAYIEKVIGNITQIIITIHGINPNAKIYIMGYYNALPNLPSEQETLFLQLLQEFNGYIIRVVDNLKTNFQIPVAYVDTYESMDKHLEQYLPGDIHPTVQGYRAIAQNFWDVIKVDFLRASE